MFSIFISLCFSEVLASLTSEVNLKTYRETFDKEGDIEIDIRKMGPNFLSPNRCSMYVTYKSKSLCMLKEVDKNKFSNDI